MKKMKKDEEENRRERRKIEISSAFAELLIQIGRIGPSTVHEK